MVSIREKRKKMSEEAKTTIHQEDLLESDILQIIKSESGQQECFKQTTAFVLFGASVISFLLLKV